MSFILEIIIAIASLIVSLSIIFIAIQIKLTQEKINLKNKLVSNSNNPSSLSVNCLNQCTNKSDEKSFTKLSELFINNLKMFITLFLLIFSFLDYLTFTEIFHFKKATFLNFYLYNTSIFDSYSLLLIIFLPLGVFTVIYSIAYTSIYFAREIQLNRVWFITKEQISKERSSFNIALLYSLLWSLFSILTFVILSFFEVKVLFYFFAGIIPIFFTNVFIIPFLNESSESKYRINSDIFLIMSVWFICLVLLMIIAKTQHYQSFIIFIILFVMVPTLFSFQLYDYIFADLNEKALLKNVKSFYGLITISILILAFLTYVFHNFNVSSWSSNEKISINLFLNKYFKSNNSKRITTDLHDIINNDITINDINVTFDKNSSYLPISKDIALYFIDTPSDINRTIVYAIDKKFYKGKYFYNTIDVGYIDKNITKHPNKR